MQLTENLKEKTEGLKNRAERLERPLWKYLLVLTVVGTSLAAGVYAVTVPDTVENDFHMRGDQTTVNGFSSYILGNTQSSQQQSVTISQNEGRGTITTSYWGIRVFYKGPDSSLTEVTGGSPVATVSRSSAGGPGLQTGTWTPPQTGVGPDDSLIVRVYQSIGQNNWEEAAAFTTDRLNASRLNSQQWNVNYYTELDSREQQGGGPPSTYTDTTFYWGSSTYDSGIDGLNYSQARVESQQLEPSTEEETWPGKSFTQEVQLTCRAETCENVKVTPEACTGASCSSFVEGENFEGLSWNSTSYNVGDMSRSQTVTKTFEVTAESEGEYRIRASINSGNVKTGDTSSNLVDVDVADVKLTQLTHENLEEYSLSEYEVGDTIDFLNTTQIAEGGKAFNLTVDPSFKDPSGIKTIWGPSNSRSCGNLSQGETCETQFNDYRIPYDAESGEYKFSVSYDWENFGPGLNESFTFEVIDIRGTINSSIDDKPLLTGSSTLYDVSIRNEWSSAQLQNLDISINCPSQLSCAESDAEPTTLDPGQEANASYTVSAPESTSSGFYTVNATVAYENPDGSKQYSQIEPITFKVADSSILITSIKDSVANSVVRGNSIGLNGSVKNNGDPADGVSLNYTLPESWSTSDPDKFIGSLGSGEKVFYGISAAVDQIAEKGPSTVYLNSTADTQEREDFDKVEIDVYSGTSISLSLGDKETFQEEKVVATAVLEEDSGALLPDQRVIFYDNTSGDQLGTAFTDSQGEASKEFEVPLDWEVKNHSIVARYERNDSIYASKAKDSSDIIINDRPNITDFTAEPSETGLGKAVQINSSISDADGVSSVKAEILYPSGDGVNVTLTNSTDRPDTYSGEFSSGWENGIYDYRILAEDEEGGKSKTGFKAFYLHSNSTVNVATDKDVYGPYTYVSLLRDNDISMNFSESFSTLTAEQFIEDTYASEFSITTGTATDVGNTRDLDGTDFTMSQTGGGDPGVDYTFEGVYSYDVEVNNPNQIDFSSYGSVSGSSWNLEVRNYDSQSWEQIATVTSTTDTWTNNTGICSSACSAYLSNDQIKVRVTSSAAWNDQSYSYNVDFQEIKVTGNEGPITETENPSKPVSVGVEGKNKNRYSSKFHLEGLPYSQSATVESARLYVNVSSGSGTGEVYNIENFEGDTTVSKVHSGNSPDSATQTNPVETFTGSQGLKSLNVTQSVRNSFEAGNRNFSLQIREQGEDQTFEIEQPVRLEVNYTTQSELFNTGSTGISGYLELSVEEKISGSWSEVEQIVPFRRIEVSSGQDFNLSQVWDSNGGFSTSLREPGQYRVQARLFGEETLVSQDGEKIIDTYNFRIGQSQPRLTEIEHDNFYQGGPSVNEFGTGDVIDFVNVSISNSEFEAADTSVYLDINRDGQNASWGPKSEKSFGNIPAGSSAERQWDNSGSGYDVPLDASSGTYTFNWDAVIDAANADRRVNRSLTFEVNDVPSNFSSEILDSDNKIYRNDSVIYNFTVGNPWSEPLSGVNVSINCDTSEISCEQEGGTSSKVEIGTISPSSKTEVSFNLSTNYSATGVGTNGNYDINATVEYVNPGGEEKTWEEYRNKIMQVRRPGSLLNVTNTPREVVRNGGGYSFNSFANNTYTESLDNQNITWEIPSRWENTTGNLTVIEPMHQPGEIVWNNFTASIGSDARLGEKRVNISTENDQGRIDSDFRYIDVYAPTNLALNVNESDPAKDETVNLQAYLTYANGTPVQGEEISFVDERKDQIIGTGFTNSTGYISVNYRAEEPYGDHRINASYTGSDSLYTTSSNSFENITVHDRPNISELNLSEQELGFGYNNTVNVSVSDRDGVQDVNLTVTYPNFSQETFQMNNIGGDIWSYEFAETWQYGEYDIGVTAVDNFEKTSTNYSSFDVLLTETSSVTTLRNSYSPSEDVNLTSYSTPWFDRDWDYRKKIEIQQTTGNDLTRYPVKVSLTGLGSNTNDCDDIRVVENGQLKDYRVNSCNPDGETVLYTTTNISASQTESDLYVYYGNSQAPDFTNETFAYSIEDSGTYDPGGGDIDKTFLYNEEDAIFRRVDLSFAGDTDSVTVSGYNYFTDSYTTLYTGAGGSFSDTFYQDPRFSKIRVEVQVGGGNFGSASFDYNFTTSSQTSSATNKTRDLLPSLIKNTGENPFKGRALLQIERNESGNWQEVSTRYNDSTPREFSPEEIVNLGTLWNDNPWNTGKSPSGTYRAAFKLLGPSGKILSDSEGKILRTDTFQITDPASEVKVEELQIYNVTGRNQQSSTEELEASGLNTSLSVFGDNTYRVDVIVNNSESAEAAWNIDTDSTITHQGLNSSWTVTDIFYNTSSTQYTGGNFNGGEVSWNSQSGDINPGENASFSYVIEIPNNNSLRDITFEINDSSFIEKDLSELEVNKLEAVPPSPLLFQFNTSSVTRGEDLKAYANWTETIADAQAEYNITTSVLVNNTVNPDRTWTNYSFSTTSDWKRGNHSFRFYADDSSGNTGSTSAKFFEVFGIASISETDLNETRVKTGDTTRFSCRVTSDSGAGLQNYNVTFELDGNYLASDTTNSTGWGSTTYSSSQLGYQDLTCNIKSNESRFYKTGDRSQSREVRIVEEEPPKYQASRNSINSTRIFRNIRNDTVGVTSYWTDNRELNYSLPVLDDTSAPELTVPDSEFGTKPLSGTQSWANFTLDVTNQTERRDTNLTVYTNDTSSNVNSTIISNDFQIWSWSHVGTGAFRDSGVEVDQEATMDCSVDLGNGRGINNYDVNFYDNATGSWRYLGTNQTTTAFGIDGLASWSRSYSTSGDYKWKCNLSESTQKNIAPLPSDKNSTSILTVGEGDIKAPVIIGGNYGLNTTSIYREDSLKSFAKWNETIDHSYVEYDKNQSYSTQKISEPYTNNWTNYTLKTDKNWTVGQHEIKTYANDTSGNLNDSLSYQQFDVYGQAEVNWLSPTGTVEQGMNTLKCGVESLYGSYPVENYQVGFTTGSTTEFNQTNSQGVATFNYNSSDESTGTKEWSCSISDEPGLYYNASTDDTAVEQIELVEELASTVSVNLTRPANQTTLAQNKTFTSNVTLKCEDGDCGEVNASLRYNSSSLSPDTVVPEASGEPFHTVGSNTKSCNLGQGENCTVSFEVNATGEKDRSFNLDAQIKSPNAETNDTEDKEVTIDLVLITDFEYSEVAFPDAVPNETVSAPGNSGGGYSFTLTENSNDAAGAWIKMTNLTSSTSDYELRPQNTIWTLRGSSCGSADGGNSMTHSYSPLLESLEAGTTVTQCYWQNIPFGKREGTYQGTISIKVNATE